MVIINNLMAKWFRQEKSKRPFVKVLGIVLTTLIVLSSVFIAIPTASAKGESPFVDCEEIYIDMRSFTGWTDSSASFRVFTFYNDSDDEHYCHEFAGNFDNDGWYEGSNVLQAGIQAVKFCNNVYSFRIPANNLSHLRIVRTNNGSTQKWNLSPFMWDNQRSKYSVGGKSYSTQNCIKITGWDNSASWSTFTPTNNASFTTATAAPDSTITGNSNLYTIDATFYDYYTDDEVQNGWKNIRYQSGHSYWEPYQYLNSKIASASSGITYPLYFGNFFDKEDGFKGEGSSNMVNFSNWVNNSSRLGGTHKSIVGLTGTELVNGNLMYATSSGGTSNVTVPIFDESFLSSNKVGSVVNTKFPMRKVTSNGVTTYKFDSGANDNVWISADNSTISYGNTTASGAKDALYYYSAPQQNSGYGFFPFDYNRGSSAEAYNFGFGMRVDVPFNLGGDEGHYGQIKGTDGTYVDQKFTFTGDDDVWVYIDGKLVLDLGGDHQKASGSINFAGGRGTGTVSVTTGSNTLNSATRNTSFSITNDDPTVEHTLTMFYVERGMVESNLSFDFNFAPIGNELIVDKTVNTANLNNSTSFRNAVAAADTFSFNQPTANGKESTKGTISNSTYTLKNAESISFKDQFEVPTDMTVTESYGGYLNYSTTWKAVDLVLKGKGVSESSYTIGSGSGKSSSFTYQTLDDSSEFAMTRVQLSYVNTPQVGSFSVEKKMDSAGADADYSSESFPMTIYLQFSSGSQPAAYTLYDDNNVAHNNGRVTLVPDQKISFSGIPTGTRVYVVEDSDANYTVSYNFTRTNPYIVGSSSGDITVTNTPVNPDAATGKVEGEKTLDGKPYTGDMFKFVLEGVPRFDGDAANVKDTSATELNTTTVTNGKFSFGDLTFEQAGVYRYHVYEDMDYLTDMGQSFDTDFYNFNTDFLVSFTVREVDHALVVDDPVYYSYSRYEEMVAEPGASGEPVEHTMTKDDFDPDKVVEKIEFNNWLNVGNITVEKENQKGDKVQGVTFVVYKVDEDMELILDGGLSDSQKYDRLLMQIRLSDEDLEVGRGTTGTDGVANISDIPIYQDGFVKTTTAGGVNGLTVNSSDFTGYQKYVLLEIESDGTEGYSLNKTVSDRQVFSFPISGQYDFTFSYINNQLKNPSTAGSGMTIFKIIGLVLAGLSVLALGGYVLYTKKYAKRKTAKHFAK